MTLLKRELRRISDETVKDADAKGKYPIQREFEFQDVEENINGDIKNAVDHIKKKLDDFRSFYQNRLPALEVEAGIKRLNDLSDECKRCFMTQSQDINKKIETLCARLNVDSRDLFSRIDVEVISMKPTTKVEQQKETRYITHHKWENSSWRIIRWLGSTSLFDKPWTEKKEVVTGTKVVVDYDKSMIEAKKLAERFIKVLNKAEDDWLKSLSQTMEKMSKEIDNRRRDWEARKRYAEEAVQFKNIGLRLRKLSDSVVVKTTISSALHQNTDYRERPFQKIKVSATTMSIYELSRHLKLGIHQNVIWLSTHSDRRSNIVIGWDYNSEDMFTSLALGHALEKKNESQGITQVSDCVWLYHGGERPLKIKKPSNVFVLVNALQIGAAKKQIAEIRLDKGLKAEDRLYFVIQDLQEVVNAGVLEETMDNLYTLGGDIGIRHKYAVLANHTNPVYNLALVAASEHDGRTHSDEIAVIHALQSRFAFLFPRENSERSETENNIKILINKTFIYGKANSNTSR